MSAAPGPGIDGAATPAPVPVEDALSGNASTKVVRGAAARGITYGASTGAIAIAFAFVFRALTPEQFAAFAVAVAIGAIAQAIGDVAVNTVGLRLIISAEPEDRERLTAELVGLRFIVMPIMSVVGVLYAWAAGYPGDEIAAVAIVCAGATLFVASAAWIAPLVIELRAARASLVEAGRQMVIAAGLLITAVVGGGLIAYGSVYLVAGFFSVAFALALVGAGRRGISAPSRETMRVVLREASWLALAITVNSLFLKVLTLIASLEVGKLETGIFATAARVVEVMQGLPMLMAGVAYPLLTRAVLDGDDERFRNALALIIRGVLLLLGAGVVVVVVGAKPLIDIFATSDYRAAIPVLQLQAFALLASSVTQALLWAMIALRGERYLVVTNLVALTVLLVLGTIFVNANGAKGAAEAAIISEVVLLSATLYALHRTRAGAVPDLRPLAVVVAVTLVAAGIGLVLPLPPVISAIVAAVIYGAAVLGLRLLPEEVMGALPGRRGGAPAA